MLVSVARRSEASLFFGREETENINGKLAARHDLVFRCRRVGLSLLINLVGQGKSGSDCRVGFIEVVMQPQRLFVVEEMPPLSAITLVLAEGPGPPIPLLVMSRSHRSFVA